MTKSKSAKAPSRGLGRGLASLIPNVSPKAAKETISEEPTSMVDGEEVRYIQVAAIMPSRFQPRQTWNEQKLKELAESIQTSGLLQPLLVRPRSSAEVNNRSPQIYELIAGERRLRALKIAGIEKAPVIIREVDNQASLELAIVENIQREDLNPVDEALAYRRLISEFNYSQEILSQKVGRDRSTVTNSLRLLNLPKSIQKDLSEGQISAGHARALLSLEREQDRLSLEKLIIRKGLSVRETERLAREARERKTRPGKRKAQVNPEIRFMEEKLMASLGTKISIKHRGRKGKIEIEYYNLDDLERLIAKMQ